MPIPRPQSLAEKGLERHLDETAPEHNNLSYANFVNMVGSNPDKPKVDKANLARAFGVNRNTIYDWLRLYKKEQGITDNVTE